MLTYDNWGMPKPNFSVENTHKGSLHVLEWAYRHYGEEIVYACSFGAEGVVLIDLIAQVNPEAKVFFLDTSLHFAETVELVDQVARRYPRLQIRKVRPQWDLKEQAKRFGERLWEGNPDQCCHLRKVMPLKKELDQVTAWISGLRREQSPSRSHIEFINRDSIFRVIKICPLIHWTWEDVWSAIVSKDLPYHPLHDQSYPSIGCQPCTFPVEEGEDLRAGRWLGTTKQECGLHPKMR
ncbi:phosphoadenylyl-sulfate reductase [Kroppenstedtia pulmonis]|uniref:Adenosine 5'-phosphosulfate reductase n=1 Tax=Kroppenstedtia pulmonis TaxID=1380685 RepID=A0A7D3XZW0_9BACL|nr:phosphoadenylyl-sulfate reductase [Kroppenstedtia pulmonis]QKG83940.1 phosphoadenylyl-sulfate reductase [Kroppenstedtia pulmonis]